MEELPFIHLNEEDFRLAMFQQLNRPILYDPDRLASLRFNPLIIICLSFLHLNIRSLHCNLDSLTTLLKNLELRFSFIGITGTWLRD